MMILIWTEEIEKESRAPTVTNSNSIEEAGVAQINNVTNNHEDCSRIVGKRASNSFHSSHLFALIELGVIEKKSILYANNPSLLLSSQKSAWHQ